MVNDKDYALVIRLTTSRFIKFYLGNCFQKFGSWLSGENRITCSCKRLKIKVTCSNAIFDMGIDATCHREVFKFVKVYDQLYSMDVLVSGLMHRW